ncbi:MAG: PucC family protein [Bradyrhizobium sp.]|nr:PucC family protein [Bradyrhizobium sp.]
MSARAPSLLQLWTRLSSRYLPFADAASTELPLSRLMRLSLFQVSIGISVVLLNGTLNRVMIVELGVPSWLVATMVALPLVFAPLRVLIGFKSDHHRSVLGWRRVPYIWMGTLLQFGGLAIMPFALLLLSSGDAPGQVIAGRIGAALAFLLVGAGLHTTQTAGLSLATDIAPEHSRPRVVAFLYVMLMFGMMASALTFGGLLAEFSEMRLIQVIQGTAVATIVFNAIALWKMEARGRSTKTVAHVPTFQQSWESYLRGGQAMRRLVTVGLGTMAFSMEDVLLEPYGGQILHLTVGDTTKLTAALAIGGLSGFGLASRVLSRGFDPFRMAGYGALVGIPAFLAVIAAAPLSSALLFGLGTLLIGFGAGLFGHGTLTATMNLAPQDQAGLALGAWGAVQASAAGVAIALGGIMRDLVASVAPPNTLGAATGYVSVYALEIIMLLATLLTMAHLVRDGQDGRLQARVRPDNAGVRTT